MSLCESHTSALNSHKGQEVHLDAVHPAKRTGALPAAPHGILGAE